MIYILLKINKMRCCMFCSEDNNDVMYRMKDLELKPFHYCWDCLQLQVNIMWKDYFTKLKTVDCEASLQRLLDQGPPFYFRDHAIEGGKELYEFYYNSISISAKLPNSINDVFRDNLTEELKNLTLDVFYDDNLQKILTKYNIL